MTRQDRAAQAAPKRGRYHHGDLRAALIQTTIDLIGERGLPEFSMAEASRRLGVAVAAPYRHFADRDALLAAVAVRAAELLGERLDSAAASGTAAQRLAAAARTYVRFAADQRSLFQALAGSGLDKSSYPEIEHAARSIGLTFLTPAAELADGSRATHLRHRGDRPRPRRADARRCLWFRAAGNGNRRRAGWGGNARPDRRPSTPQQCG